MRYFGMLASLFVATALCQMTPTFRVETLVGADIPSAVPGVEWNLSQIYTMAAGPDGSVWFQERGWRKLTPDGRLQAVPIQGVLGSECDYSCCRSNPYYRVTISADGLPHIFDPWCDVIRRLHPDGRHEIVAGKVSRGGSPSGNGGPAKDAQLGSISSMAFDGQGNLYLLDSGVVRKIDLRGVITEFAKPPFSSRALAVNRQGAVFVAETTIPHRILKFEPDGTSSLFATGNGDPTWSLAELAVDGAGNIYGRGIGGQPIFKLTPEGKLQAIPNTSNFADGFAVDRAGNVYFSDTQISVSVADPQGRVRRVAGGGQMGMYAGNAKYVDFFPKLYAVAIPNSQGMWLGLSDSFQAQGLYLLDPSSRIQRIVPDDNVRSMAFDSTASLYYTGGGEVLKLDSAHNGARVSVVPALSRLSSTSGLALDSQDRLYLSYALAQQHVARFDPRTAERTVVAGNGIAGDSGDGGLATAAQLQAPGGLAVDRDGSVYIADYGAHRVRKVDPGGRISTVAGTGLPGIGAEGVAANTTPLSAPTSVAMDAFGNLFIAEWSNLINRIRLMDRRGIIRTIAGGLSSTGLEDGTLSTEAKLDGPTHLQISRDGTIYFVDGKRRAMKLIPEITEYPRTTVPGIVHAATSQSGAVSPGMILTIFGRNIGPANLVKGAAANGRLGNTAGQTSARFDGVPAPILYASLGQIGVMVPYAVTPGKRTTLVIVVDQAESTPVELDVVAARPGLFTANSSGRGPGAILNQNGSLNSASNPAQAGSIVVLYGTGEGQTTPAGSDGRIATGTTLPRPRQPVAVTICGKSAEILYAGAAPGAAAGLLQVNARVPSACAGQRAAEVLLTVGSATSPAEVTVAVE